MNTKYVARNKMSFQFLLILIVAFWQFNLSAQNYNFTFNNGDVINGVVDPKDRVQVKTDGISKVEIIEGKSSVDGNISSQPTESSAAVSTTLKTSSDDKLKRTGLGFITGYSHSSFVGSKNIFKGSDIKTFRAGLSFISSYDFSINVEFLSSTINAQTLDGSFDGNIPGLSIGASNNYWLSENLAFTLGANIRGLSGDVSNLTEEFVYRSFGGGISVGPTLQLGNLQFMLAYEYGLDNISIATNDDVELYERQWSENSAVKGVLSFKF